MLPRDTAARVVLARDQVEVATWPLVVRGPVDLSTVDELARLQLAAHRLGYWIELRDACPELTELLEFAGLGDLVTGTAGQQLQAVGEAEGGEEVGVEEVVVPDDPVA